MGSYGVPSGINATILGGEYSGMNANTWGGDIFLKGITARFVGHAAAVVVAIWEYLVLAPNELVLWQRIFRRGYSGRSSFAPWTTMGLRYALLTFGVSQAFDLWSTTMVSDAACRAASAVVYISMILCQGLASFAIAWRAQAVAKGVVQKRSTLRWLQVSIGILVFLQAFMIIFNACWRLDRQKFWRGMVDNGRCTDGYVAIISPHYDLEEDPQVWYYVITVIFNLFCLLLVSLALRTLASRSRGFSKFITAMYYHSTFYFVILFLLCALGLVWLRIQNADWLLNPITVFQTALVIRILLAEQDAARRPLDTTYIDAGTLGHSRYLSRSGMPPGGGGTEIPTRNDATVQFADRMPYYQHHGEGGGFDEEAARGMGRGLNGPLNDRTTGGVGLPMFHPMDNLGQAFSQIDSRNPNDIDQQSFDMGDGDDDGAREPYDFSDQRMRAATRQYPGLASYPGHADAAEVEQVEHGYADGGAGQEALGANANGDLHLAHVASLDDEGAKAVVEGDKGTASLAEKDVEDDDEDDATRESSTTSSASASASGSGAGQDVTAVGSGGREMASAGGAGLQQPPVTTPSMTGPSTGDTQVSRTTATTSTSGNPSLASEPAGAASGAPATTDPATFAPIAGSEPRRRDFGGAPPAFVEKLRQRAAAAQAQTKAAAGAGGGGGTGIGEQGTPGMLGARTGDEGKQRLVPAPAPATTSERSARLARLLGPLAPISVRTSGADDRGDDDDGDEDEDDDEEEDESSDDHAGRHGTRSFPG